VVAVLRRGQVGIVQSVAAKYLQKSSLNLRRVAELRRTVRRRKNGGRRLKGYTRLRNAHGVPQTSQLGSTNVRTSKRFNLVSRQLRSLPYLQRSESLNLMPPTFVRADAVHTHGTGWRWQS